LKEASVTWYTSTGRTADSALGRALWQVRQRRSAVDIAVSVHVGDLADRIVAFCNTDAVTVPPGIGGDITIASGVAANADRVAVAVRPTVRAAHCSVAVIHDTGDLS
jgi:hypothetical protein